MSNSPVLPSLWSSLALVTTDQQVHVSLRNGSGSINWDWRSARASEGLVHVSNTWQSWKAAQIWSFAVSRVTIRMRKGRGNGGLEVPVPRRRQPAKNFDCFVARSPLMKKPQQVTCQPVVAKIGRLGTCSLARREPNALVQASWVEDAIVAYAHI